MDPSSAFQSKVCPGQSGTTIGKELSVSVFSDALVGSFVNNSAVSNSSASMGLFNCTILQFWIALALQLGLGNSIKGVFWYCPLLFFRDPVPPARGFDFYA